jgi:hypothetical protein
MPLPLFVRTQTTADNLKKPLDLKSMYQKVTKKVRNFVSKVNYLRQIVAVKKKFAPINFRSNFAYFCRKKK